MVEMIETKLQARLNCFKHSFLEDLVIVSNFGLRISIRPTTVSMRFGDARYKAPTLARQAYLATVNLTGRVR